MVPDANPQAWRNNSYEIDHESQDIQQFDMSLSDADPQHCQAHWKKGGYV